MRGEWFAIEPADILPILQCAGPDGFVAKNADAFQIIGYDRDAIPEYLGVWEWADLEIDECCPFCGCLCGMHFQDSSRMYHSIRCDTLTDFSELDPHEDPPEDWPERRKVADSDNLISGFVLFMGEPSPKSEPCVSSVPFCGETP